MLDTSLTHYVNIAHRTCVMEKCGIALIGCFNDAFCKTIPQDYSVIFTALGQWPSFHSGFKPDQNVRTNQL